MRHRQAPVLAVGRWQGLCPSRPAHDLASTGCVMSATMRCIVTSLRRYCATDAAAIERDDDVADADDLLEIARGHHQRVAFLAESSHQPVDFGARADVDAARRLVHQQNAVRLRARCCGRTRASADCRRSVPRPASAGAAGRRRRAWRAVQRPPRNAPPCRNAQQRMIAKPRCHQIMQHAQAAKHAFRGAVAGDEHDAVTRRTRRRAEFQRPAVDRDLPAASWTRPASAADDLRGPEPDLAGDAR